MKDMTCKLLVVGAGPGGYVCAIRAGQLGLDTVIVESDALGGTCLNVGCIPSKALIHAADEFHKLRLAAGGHSSIGIRVASPEIDFPYTIAWKNTLVERLNLGVSGLLKRAGVKTIKGWSTFRDGKTVEVTTEIGVQVIRAEFIVIATGSCSVELPNLPFGGLVISSTEALALDAVPSSMAVIGGGYIGLELGTAFAKLGSHVTVVEVAEKVLPQYDGELVRPVISRLDEIGVAVLTGAKAIGLSANGDGIDVEVNGVRRMVAVDKILVTVGRQPAVDGWGLEILDLDRDGQFIHIDDQCRTSMRGVFAIGDVSGQPMLAHRAMAQGEMVADILAGMKRSWDKVAVPAVCFTDPEIVDVGLSPKQAADLGIQAVSMQFPFQANGRAMTTEREDGFVRIVAREDNHLVLGVQAVGANVSELSTAFSLCLEMGARMEDVAATIHVHPTKGEAFQEVALRTLGHALHI
ncbi:MAG: dihydrolipoyl dehydrogenase [Alphaproteobacteria bacterium]|nr:dihydrolipoyl dehydrogenase [Alphaproteobacteria bacterium]